MLFLKLIAAMGTEIQAKSYFSGSDSMRDLNDSAGSGIWALYREHNTLKNDQYYNTFLTRPNIDGYVVYDREQLRQTILKHESIFRHQLWLVWIFSSLMKSDRLFFLNDLRNILKNNFSIFWLFVVFLRFMLGDWCIRDSSEFDGLWKWSLLVVEWLAKWTYFS